MSHACKLLIFLTLSSAALAACSVPLNGQQRGQVFIAATAAYDAGDYKTARQKWTVLAKQADPAAMRNLGHLYRKGLGVKQSAAKARDYYHQAARLDFAPAQMNLAMMYLTGMTNGKADGKPRPDKLAYDGKQGFFWLERAAAGGYRPAIDYLRQMKMRVIPHNP